MSGLPFPLIGPDGSQRELLIVRFMGKSDTSERLAAMSAAEACDGVRAVLGFWSEHPYLTDGPLEPFSIVLELAWDQPSNADQVVHAIAQALDELHQNDDHSAHLLGYTRTYLTDAHIMDGHLKPESWDPKAEVSS